MCLVTLPVLGASAGLYRRTRVQRADGASIIDPDGKGPAIGVLRVPERKSAKNRMHIDIRVAGEPPWDMTEREQLIRALDPEGNEFCGA